MHLLTAVLALAVSGCERSTPDALRFGLAEAPENLDPRFATNAVSTRVNRLLYSRLVDFDEHFQPVPSLAHWARISPQHYRFTLRADRSPFHDGQALSAQDVVATYESVLDPLTGSPHRGSLHMIERVQALDHDTIDFHLKQADALFAGRLVVGILPADRIAADHKFNEEPIGSGPFRFDSWPQPEHLRIARISDGAVVEFQRVQKPDVRVLKLLRGELDVLQGDMPPELLAWTAAREQVRVVKRAGTTFAYLGFNLEDPLVGDLRVRQAIGHALDRDAIIRYLWSGNARPAGGILTADHWAGLGAQSAGNSGSAPGLKHDPQRARALLAEAGYGAGKPLRIIYKTSTNPLRVRIATVIQHQLAKVGIDMQIRTYDWGTFYGDIKAGNFQIYSLAWVGIKMPDIFRYVFHSDSIPPVGANRGRLRNAQMDALIDRAERADELSEQARLYQAIQILALEQLPYVPLWFEDQVLVANDRLNNYRMSRDGNFDALARANWQVIDR
jgi:peptide/nickel transport system substrate-binding protein